MKIKNLIEGLNAQQRSVPQLPAQARARHISVLGAKTDPKHPFAGYMVGADESVAEGKPQKRADRYHINKDGKPASLASYADRASAVKDRDAKYPDAKVHQVGPRGKVKGEFEEGMAEAGPGDINRLEHRGEEYNVYFNQRKGMYTARGTGQMSGQIAPQWFRTLDDAIDHAEMEIGSYDEQGLSEEFDSDNNPWRVTDVDPMSETDFEVALQGPGGQQLNFVIRPVDFMETRFQRYQIDTMDVRDLQTGKTMHWGSMNDLGQWEPIFDAIDTYFWESPALQARLEKIISYYMDAGEQGKNPDMMPGLDQRDPNGVAVSADDFIASHNKTQNAMSKMKKGAAEGEDLSEKLGALRPKLGTGRDVGKSVRNWRKQRGLSESDTQDKTDTNFFRKFSNLIAEAEQQITEVTRRDFLKASVVAAILSSTPVAKLMSNAPGKMSIVKHRGNLGKYQSSDIDSTGYDIGKKQFYITVDGKPYTVQTGIGAGFMGQDFKNSDFKSDPYLQKIAPWLDTKDQYILQIADYDIELYDQNNQKIFPVKDQQQMKEMYSSGLIDAIIGFLDVYQTDAIQQMAKVPNKPNYPVDQGDQGTDSKDVSAIDSKASRTNPLDIARLAGLAKSGQATVNKQPFMQQPAPKATPVALPAPSDDNVLQPELNKQKEKVPINKAKQ